MPDQSLYKGRNNMEAKIKRPQKKKQKKSLIGYAHEGQLALFGKDFRGFKDVCPISAKKDYFCTVKVKLTMEVL